MTTTTATRRFRKLVTAGAVAAVALVATTGTASASEPVWYGYDVTGDGWNETWMTDGNGDGWIDLAAFDLDLNGVRDGLAWDSSGNGLFDIIGMDANESGTYEVYGVDQDDNGTIDVAYFDVNENGVEDTQENMYPTTAYVGQPTYGGTGQLLLTMAAMTGSATWGTPDSDGDGWNDRNDDYPSDPRYI